MNKSSDIPVIGPALRRIFGSRNERFVKRYSTAVEQINGMEPSVRRLSDAELRAKTGDFRRRFEEGERAEDLMLEVFAVAREAMDRSVGIRNIFNPEHREAFDASALPENLRAVYLQTMQEMDALEDAPPEGEFLGNEAPVPGWLQTDIPTELYEAVREIHPKSRPPFRARPFDVQLIGAMVLSQGKIAEMKTGEGKTIVAPLACYLASLQSLSCHVVTVNDYLVQRDRDWVFPFFHALGMTVGAIHPSHMQPESMKRGMYACDVVYGTTSEFGFDYLRDNMKRSVEQQVQRRRDFAVVDEVDSVLIDEARTPLIISGPAYDDQPRYDMADKLARDLVQKQRPWQERDDRVQAALKRIKGLEGDIRNARDKSKVPAMQEEIKRLRAEIPKLEAERDQHTQYYEVEMDRKQAHLTHHGIEEAQRQSGIGSFYVGENMDLPHLLQQAVRAHTVYQRDRDYVVMPVDNPQTGQKEPSVVIVDVFTGRLQIGRQWSDGLHQAVEAKESVPIKQETQTIATVTIQNFFKMYDRLAGMTGTADTEAQEFHDIYGLDVVVIPTNEPVIRADHNDTVYLSEKDKWDAIVEEIRHFHDIGRPVLVGTTSVEKSERVADMLQRKHSIPHAVLNAKQHEREAEVIADAGELGAVMIATNMAGRGTDIKLARTDRAELVEHWKRRGLAPRDLSPDDDVRALREKIYRKIATKTLDVKKAEVEQMDFESLELALLRHWAVEHTWADPKKIDRYSAEDLRAELDEQGRFALHNLDWYTDVERMGGLHVVGTERHESRRIDNQLRGRSGRQGDRGSSRFFVSLEDDLMKMFAGETTMRILSRLGMKEGDAIEHPMLTRSVERAQRKVEERNFQIRKNILEYDEVMEHQRQIFYGLRQRAVEGRDMKGLIFDYIEDAVGDAVEKHLDRDYPYECVADAAVRVLDVSVPQDRIRGVDPEDMEQRVRKVAKDEARMAISMTIAEYLSEETEEEARDYTGLANWAAKEFRTDIKPSELRGMDPRAIEERINEAAGERIDEADLSEVVIPLEPGFGMKELVRWAHAKFEIELDPSELEGFEEQGRIVERITDEARARYRTREIEYPVDFALQMTMALMRQSPQEASARLVRWANTRFDLGLEESSVRTRTPQQIRDQLVEASRGFVESGALATAVDEALACEDDEALAAFFRERFDAELPERVREARPGEERDSAVRAAVENVLRGEMVQFERYILLDTLDQAWKEHLRSMDQLRDSIGFRAFSQKDPRIEYKREGARLLEEMQQTVRDRVTEFVFKMRLRADVRPGAGAPQQQPQQGAQGGDGQAPPTAPAGAPPNRPAQPVTGSPAQVAAAMTAAHPPADDEGQEGQAPGAQASSSGEQGEEGGGDEGDRGASSVLRQAGRASGASRKSTKSRSPKQKKRR